MRLPGGKVRRGLCRYAPRPRCNPANVALRIALSVAKGSARSYPKQCPALFAAARSGTNSRGEGQARAVRLRPTSQRLDCNICLCIARLGRRAPSVLVCLGQARLLIAAACRVEAQHGFAAADQIGHEESFWSYFSRLQAALVCAQRHGPELSPQESRLVAWIDSISISRRTVAIVKRQKMRRREVVQADTEPKT